MDSAQSLTAIGYPLLALAVAAVAAAAYLAYPSLEERLLLAARKHYEWIVSMRERMFSPVSRTQIRALLAGAPLGFCLFGFVLSYGHGWLTALFTLFCLYLGWMAPRWIVTVQWKMRLRKFDMQLVDALNLMANSLKSGLNLPQVVEVVVKEMPNPLSQEFGLIVSQQKLGLTIDEALAKMLDRIPSDDLAVAINAILILRETGGDLSETFDVIAGTIRERRKVDGKIRAVTAQGRTQGLILLLFPIALLVLFADYVRPLFTTQLGWMLLFLVLVLEIVGALWMKKILTIDV